jgi:hypothetical protein
LTQFYERFYRIIYQNDNCCKIFQTNMFFDLKLNWYSKPKSIWYLFFAGFELTPLVLIGTDWIGSYKSNYHKITTTTLVEQRKNLSKNNQTVWVRTPLRCTRYNIMWLSLSVTCDRSVFFPGTPVSSTNKTDHHDIAEILLKVVLSTIILTALIG